MLQGARALHESPGGGDRQNGVVGISWKPGRGSHSSSSLIVTCAHQVVVYKPGEWSRIHQWSFRPSASTVFSHATAFLPLSARYVGVQRGTSLVTWLERDPDVRRPLSVKTSGPIHAVHACPQLGDFVIVVLVSGAILLYRGGLEIFAQCDVIIGDCAEDGAGAPAAEVLWSGVRGKRVLLLLQHGSTTRIAIFTISLTAKRSLGSGAPATIMSGTVALASSHVLAKPALHTTGSGRAAAGTVAEAAGDRSVDEEAKACSAAILAGSGGVLSVAWRSSRGPLWTKVVVSSSGAREEFARLAGALPLAAPVPAAEVEGVAALCNGHKPAMRSPKKIKSKQVVAPDENRLMEHASGDDASFIDSWPALATADGGRLLVHSGGSSPRLATWDAMYGVLLDDGDAPEITTGSGSSAGVARSTRAVNMVVSGDGAHLALAVGGRVLICPLPVKEAGTLASLLRRKRPAAMVAGTACGGANSPVSHLRTGEEPTFPAVDLACNVDAARVLLQDTGTFSPGEWEKVVISPFRVAESAVVRSLEDAARRKDGEEFERVLQEHMHHSAALAVIDSAVSENKVKDSVNSGVAKGDSAEASSPAVAVRNTKNRRRGNVHREEYSAGIVAAAVELCIANPRANLWAALGLLVRSGGVSARHHRGLVEAIVRGGPQELLEEVMLYVPDLPEVDVVRILRYFLLQAARLAKQSKDLPPLSITTDAEGDDGPPPAKRSKTDRKRLRNHAVRGDEAGDGDELRLSQKHISSSVNGGRVSVVENASVGRNIQKSGVVGEGEEENGGETMESKVKEKKMMDMPTSLSNVVLTTNEQHPKHGKLNDKLVIVDADGKSTAEVHRASNGTLPNGHAHGHDDGGGTSSESGGGVSEEEREEAAPVTGDHGEPTRQEGGKRVKGPKTPCGTKRSTGVVAPAAACAERGVRVALTLPHNEAFLRSALSVLSYQEVIVVLKVLTRVLSEGRTRETMPISTSHMNLQAYDKLATNRLPSVRTDAVLGWASALLDSHFTRLALGGAVDTAVSSALQALTRTVGGEAECCELLCQVRSLVHELGRRQAAAEAERRRPKHTLYTVEELRF